MISPILRRVLWGWTLSNPVDIGLANAKDMLRYPRETPEPQQALPDSVLRRTPEP